MRATTPDQVVSGLQGQIILIRKSLTLGTVIAVALCFRVSVPRASTVRYCSGRFRLQQRRIAGHYGVVQPGQQRLS